MKLRHLLTSFRTKRARRLSLSDSVSFDNFCNDTTTERFPHLKESSLNDSFDISPIKLTPSDCQRLAREPVIEVNSSRPTLATVLLFIVLSAVFLILPIIYLLNCFDIIYEHQHLKHNPIVQPTAEHYENHEEFRKVLLDEMMNLHNRKALPPPPKPDYGQCRLLKNVERFDCFPEKGANQDGCESRGCCWIPAKIKPSKRFKDVPLDVPYCFYPPNYNTYQFLNVTETAYGLVAYLKRSFRTAYPDDIELLQMTVKYETETRLNVKFIDPLIKRYESEYPEVPIVERAAQNLKYIFELETFRPGFKVVRKDDNTTIFDSNMFLDFTFADQFLQLSSKLPSKFIYGIGDHTSKLLLNTQWSRFTLWNHDMPPEPNKNLYGSHPFYMMLENSTKAHGVFLHNSNAMDILLQPTPAITFRSIGGVLDFYFFMGPTPNDVIAQYTDLIGRPYMPPYWGLGFHLCRFGYKSLNHTKEIMENNLKAGIPIDTQWNDLDYMNNSNDFTYDRDFFDGLPGFVNDLHKRGMHYIPLVDPGVSAGEKVGSYPPYDLGIKMDIFVKNSSGKPFIGKVWNSHSTVWPDFTHPNTVDYWTLMLKNFHGEVPFDGAWIDMNEPSNFLSGSFDGCPKAKWESPPYLPAVDGGALNYKTMCMTAEHYAGIHYDVHNVYGMTEAIMTSFALAEIRGKRPMVITRATYSGLGRYAGHWSGDVYSTWDALKQSIPHLLSFSLYGIPLMGADICGFNGNTTVPLCNRWHQLGAFYPFSRNHNTDDGIPQDPASMGDLVISSTKRALQVRYALLPYLYTLFYRAHVYGETVARPLFFEFYNDNETFGIDEEFLWGADLLIIPVLEEGATSVKTYLPKSFWYDYYTKYYIESSGEFINFTAPLDTIPVFIRGGSIIPQQEPKQTTSEARKTKIQLLVAMDEKGEAEGELFWDDGDSLNTIEENHFTLINFNLQDGVLRSRNDHWAEEYPPHLGTVTVLGVQKPVTEVKVNNVSKAFKFDTVHKFLVIDDLDVSFKKPLVISWK